MLVNYNGMVRPLFQPFYLILDSSGKLSADQLKKTLSRVIKKYTHSAINENNNRSTGKVSGTQLRADVKSQINTIITDLFKNIVDDKISVTSGSSSSSKVFNLGSYVDDINTELNQIVNNSISV